MSTIGDRLPRWHLLSLLGLFLLALLVRLAGLTIHSLWFDEAVSTYWASQPLADIWRVGLSLTEDKHPPLYYTILRGWTGILGDSDPVVRLLGVVIGALAVLPTYVLGTWLGDRRAGLFAGFLVALNPFLVWYSQEVRMFMPATTFLLVGMVGVVHLWTADRPLVSFSLIAIGFLASLYSYLFSAFMLPVAAAWLLVLWWVNRQQKGAGKRLGYGLGALGLTGLLFLPLLRATWSVSSEESVPGRPFTNLGTTLSRFLPTYLLGWASWPSPGKQVVSALMLALALGGLIIPQRAFRKSAGSNDGESSDGQPSARSRPIAEVETVRSPPLESASQTGNRLTPTSTSRYTCWRAADLRCGAGEPRLHQRGQAFTCASANVPGGLLLAIWLVLPILAGGILMLKDGDVFGEIRYFIFLVPALCLAIGRTLAWLWLRWRVVAAVALAFCLIASVAALPGNWAPENRREDWRGAANYISSHGSENEAVLLYIDYMRTPFERYFDGPQGLFFPLTEALDDPATVDESMQGLVGSGFDAVWVVQSHHQDLDPQNLLLNWFSARYPLITEQFPPGIAIHGYATGYRMEDLPPQADAARVSSPAGNLELLSCLYDEGPLSASDDLVHPPSNWIHVTTYWTINEPAQEDLFHRVQLVDSTGQVWGDRLERAGDTIHIWPVSRWVPGEIVRVDYDVNLNPITPAGEYQLVVQAPGWEGEATCGKVIIE
ncbi:MAG: glycosyltransferase family 39 protein [Chloroflexota bacterium]|nr:glycosyltransferase family 39 protein [Chloroflexota bacterium]